ncbi:hypothetical protein [Sulfurimonas sp.]
MYKTDTAYSIIWFGYTTSMRHIAIQEEADGSNVTWLEGVSEEDYAQ